MTYSTVDDLVIGAIGRPTGIGKDSASNEAAGIPHTPWYTTGLIGAGAAPTGGLNGATLSGTVSGQIPIPAAVAGQTVALSRLSAVHAGGIGHLWIVDRLWGDVPVVTTTTSQAITSPAWPARDYTGSTSGERIYLALECSSATGNAGAITNTTVSYTSSAGTAGRTATLASYPATAVAGTWVPLSLQAGDTGVRSVQSITLGTSYVSGAVHLVAFRYVASLPLPSAYTGNDRNWLDLGLPTIYDNSVLQLVYLPTSTTVAALSGDIWYAQA